MVQVVMAKMALELELQSIHPLPSTPSPVNIFHFLLWKPKMKSGSTVKDCEREVFQSNAQTFQIRAKAAQASQV